MSLLEVDHLKISFTTPDGVVPAVEDLSFTLEAGAALAIVGESGSGKSQTALAILGLQAGNAIVEGSIRFEEQPLIGLSERAYNRIRGNRIGMIFQDPMSSLNPYLQIGTQMIEALQQHRGASRVQALAECRRLLDRVRIADAPRLLKQYPHECSGGMRQRITIAMALSCAPRLLIADEPTTALDVTVQAQILMLLQELRSETGVALLLITHDLAVVAELCERTLVLRGGRVMESGMTGTLLRDPQHPYTRALLAARPQISGPLTRRLAEGLQQREEGLPY